MKGQNTVNTASESPFFLWFIPLILTIGGIVSIYAMSGFETGVLWWKQFVWALISAAGFMAVVMTPLRV